jgi:hypothetical protein
MATFRSIAKKSGRLDWDGHVSPGIAWPMGAPVPPLMLLLEARGAGCVAMAMAKTIPKVENSCRVNQKYETAVESNQC